jgi:hypothetical protein
VAGYHAGYQASKKAQEWRGQQFSPTQARIEGAVSALPPFMSRGAKTASQFVRRQATKYGLLAGGTSAAMQAGRQMDQGVDLQDVRIDPLETGLAIGAGSVISGGLSIPGGRAVARATQKANQEAAELAQRGGGNVIERQARAATEAAARGADAPDVSVGGVTAQAQEATEKATQIIAANKAARKARRSGQPTPAAATQEVAEAATTAAPDLGPVAPREVANLKEGQKAIKQGFAQLRRDLTEALGRENIQGSKKTRINAIIKRAKNVMAGKGGPEAYEKIQRELAELGMGGDRLAQISDAAPRMAPDVQAAAEAAAGVARRGQPRPTQTPEQKLLKKLLKKLEYSNTPSGERAARAKAKRLNELFPDSEAKASRVVESLGGKKVKVHGWRVTSKQSRSKAAQGAIEARKQAKQAAAAAEADPLKPKLEPGKKGQKKPDLGPQQQRVEAPPASEEDFLPTMVGEQIPDDVEELLGGAAVRPVQDEFDVTLPKGTKQEDWDTHKIGTEVLSRDFARRAQEKGYKVWVTPGKAKKGGEIMGGAKLGEPTKGTGKRAFKAAQGWEVHVEKGADVKDLLTDVGRAPHQPQLGPGEFAAGNVPRQPGALGRPGRGVKLKSEEKVVGPTEGATIGDVVAPTPAMLRQAKKASDAALQHAAESHPNLGARAAAKQELAARAKPTPPPAVTPEKPIDKSLLDKYLAQPTGKQRDPVMNAEITPMLRERARKMSSEDLRKAAENAPDAKIRNAALDELDQRLRSPDVDPAAGIPKENAAVLGHVQKMKARQAELRGKLATAMSAEAGAIRAEIKRLAVALAKEEEGSWNWWPTPKHRPQVEPPSNPKLDRLEAKQEKLMLGGAEREGMGPLSRAWKGIGNKAWALQQASLGLERSGNTLRADQNPWKIYINYKDAGLGEFAQTASEVTDLVGQLTQKGLGKVGRRAFNLMNFIREEVTFGRNLDRTTTEMNAARNALEAHRALTTKPKGYGKELNRLNRVFKAKQKALKKAESRWKNLARGKGLPEGMKPGEASEYLKILKDGTPAEDWKMVEDVMTGWAKANDYALDLETRLGQHITPAMADEMRARGPYLAPLQRHVDVTTKILKQRMDTGVRQKLIDPKQAQIMMELAGDPSVPVDPFTGGLQHLELGFRETYHAYMTRRIVDSLREFEPYKGAIIKVNEGAAVDPNMAKIPIFRGGPKPEYWQVPRDLGEVIMTPTALEMELYGLGPARFLIQKSKNALTKSAVVFAMGFGFGRNPPRDVKAARSFLPDVYHLNNPVDVIKTAGEYFHSAGSLMFEGSRNPFTGQMIGKDIGAARRTGVFNSTLQVGFNPKLYLHDKWYKSLGVESSEIKNPLMRGAGFAGRGLAHLTGHMENATKLMTFRRFMDTNYHPEEALYLTKMLGGSPNFSLGGDHKRVLDAFLMFFSPGLRGQEQTLIGLDRLARLPGGPPTKAMELGMTGGQGPRTPVEGEAMSLLTKGMRKFGSRKITRYMTTLAAGALVREQWNRQFKDENGKPYIEYVDPQFRENNWIMFTPFGMKDTEWGRVPYYFSMPKAHVQMLLQVPFERMAARMAGETEGEFTSTVGFLEHTAEQIVPLGGQINFDESLPSNLMDNLAASAVPVVGATAAIRENRDPRTGNPIISPQVLGSGPGARLPQHRYTDQTSPFLTQVAQKSEETFGNLLGLEPWAVDYFLKKQFPGQYWAGRAAEDMIRYGWSPSGGRGTDMDFVDAVSRIPGFGDVFRNFVGPQGAPPAQLMHARKLYYKDRQHAQQSAGSGKFMAEQEQDPSLEGEIILNQGEPMDQFLNDFRAYDLVLADVRNTRSRLMREYRVETDQAKRERLLRDLQGVNTAEMNVLTNYVQSRKEFVK